MHFRNVLAAASLALCASAARNNATDIAASVQNRLAGIELGYLHTNIILDQVTTGTEDLETDPKTKLSTDPSLPKSPVSVSFLMLESLNGSLEVEGAIQSIDLPSLLNTSETISIVTSHPLNLSLPLVSSSGYIKLFGELRASTSRTWRVYRACEFDPVYPSTADRSMTGSTMAAILLGISMNANLRMGAEAPVS
ncbi:hypothetical protein BJX65DRAFT_311050 [Aspergillus insuetus]